MSDSPSSPVTQFDRRTALKVAGAAAGLTLVSLPPSAASASVSGFTGSGYSSGSTATMQLRFNIQNSVNGDRNVRLEFHRTSYIPSGTAMQVKVDWGDGTPVQTYTSSTTGTVLYAPGNDSFSSVKTYAADGIYTVTITEATPGIGIGSGSQNGYGTEGINMLTDVLSWSNIGSLAGGFMRATALTSVPNYLPTGVVNLEGCFKDCSSFNSPINNWDTSRVTSMYYTFGGATAFNQNIGSWNLAACTNLRDMFRSATVFNNGGSDSINNWNTQNVTTMFQTFSSAVAFNQPVGGWNTSNVTTMNRMFNSATLFNNGGNTNIDGWNTSKVTDMEAMFQGASSFNQPVGSWSTGAVTTMRQMFNDASSFNQPIGSWNTANVTDMVMMFEAAFSFNQPIGSWNTANVTTMVRMFYRTASPAMAFDQNISGWNVSKVGSNTWGFVNSAPGGAAFYQAGWLASERPAGFPTFTS